MLQLNGAWGEFSGAHLHGVALGAAGDEKVNLSRWDRDISPTYDEAPAAQRESGNPLSENPRTVALGEVHAEGEKTDETVKQKYPREESNLKVTDFHEGMFPTAGRFGEPNRG